MAFPHRDRIKDALIRLIASRGGSMNAGETYEPLAKEFNLTEEDLALSTQGGSPGSKWPNELQWAREDLVREEILLPVAQSGHGVWKLSSPAENSDGELEQLHSDLEDDGLFNPANLEDARDIVLRAIVQRRGQQSFRKILLQEYGQKCAITGETCVAVLEAAHIVPYKGLHTNSIRNGILLRADIHTLFDLALIAVDSAYRIQIAPSLKSSGYHTFAGRQLALPENPDNYPSKTALAEHRARSKF